MVIKNGYCFFWKAKIANWHMCNFEMVCLDNIKRTFNSSEQAFMYLKAEKFNDKFHASMILSETNQRVIKDLGRAVIGYDDSIWNSFREEAMFRACYAKFSTNTKEKEELLKYKDLKFVEASPFDCIWGVGLAEDNPLIEDEKNWRGLNLLGKCLDKVLLTLQNEIKN